MTRRLAIVAALLGIAAPCLGGDPPAVPAHRPDPGGHWGAAAGPDRAGAPATAALVAGAAAAAACSDFNTETFCSTGWGWQWFGVRVAGGLITFRAWSNLFNVPSPCPLSFTFHFGDGSSETAPGTSTGSGSFVSVTHKYAQAGSYTVSITASDGAATLSCTMTTISVASCWQDGVLCYQGDNLTWSRPSPFTFGVLDADPPVRVNGTMHAAGHSRVEYTYSGGVLTSSTFKPTGRVYVPAAGGDVELFAPGQAPAFAVAWNAGTMQPQASDLTRYSWAGGGLPLWVGEAPLTFEPAALVLGPLGIVGIPKDFEIARFAALWRLAAAANPQFVSAELKSGALTPSLKFGGIAATYAPPPQDVLDVEMELQFPFSKGPSFAAKFRHQPCGLNLADVTLAGFFGNDVPIATVGPVTLGIAGWRSALDHVCDGQGLAITVGGSLEAAVGGVEIPGEYFSIDDVSLKYEHPLDFEIQGGTAKVLGHEVANVHGQIRTSTPPFAVQVTGTVNIAGAIVGRVTELHSLDSSRIMGSAVGVGRIPEFSCSWWDQPCKVVRALARAALGPLPYEVHGQSFFIQGAHDRATQAWHGTFMTEYAVRSLTLVLVVDVAPGGTTVLVGNNLGDLFQLGASSQSVGALEAVQRSVELPAGLPGVLFAATGRNAVPPQVTLRDPAGRTLTQAAPGPALWSASAAENAVLFEVPYPAAGTWTLAADGLPAADLALFALAPRARPALAFTRVEHSGTNVEIEATVEPASPTATVQFHFGATAAGGLGEPIGEPLPAAAGLVATTWDVAALPPGTYYLFGEAAEPGTLPVTVYAATPVTIAGASPLDAPTALAGTRDGATATLTWTPATAPEAVAHVILSTDDPTVAGYSSSRAATAPGAASVSGLAPERSYRFAVVAVNADGAPGPPSNELVLAGSGGACSLTCAADAPAEAALREPAKFVATVTAEGCSEPVVIDWTFGDGGGASGSSVYHAFASAGDHTWQVAARAGIVSCESAGTITVTAVETAPRRRLRRHLDPLP